MMVMMDGGKYRTAHQVLQTNTLLLKELDITENVVSLALGEGNRPLGIFIGKESEFLFIVLYFHLLWSNQR